jgi:hypothetical protein
MGNSYTIDLIPKGVHIGKENGVSVFKGESGIPLYKVVGFIKGLKEFEEKSYSYWIYDKSINIFVHEEKGDFYAITLESCLSNVEVGTKDMMGLAKLFGSIADMDVYIMGKKFAGDDPQRLFQSVEKEYKARLKKFREQYGNTKFRGTELEFEKELKKQNKWYRVLARKYGMNI